MEQRQSYYVIGIIVLFFGSTIPLSAQPAMTMPGMENSVGFQSSGTSIQPTVTSEFEPMIHTPLGHWTVMFHGNAFVVGLQQRGPKGADKFFSSNWIMPMLTRDFGRHRISFRSMLSFEPLTVTRRQYPLLLQTGETAFGFAIVNGQHPHELFMELATRYDFKAGERSSAFLYGALVGEAALGPTGFPHRPSASENPVAVLSHHMQDATHIATNVITAGIASGPFQLEGSTFHGREPDENRWNINRGKPDSFAGRLTVSANKYLTAQVSTGRINNPEGLSEDADTVRTTASIHYSVPFSSGHVASSLIWGRNKDVEPGVRRVFNSYNLEVTAKFKRRNWIWTRIENVDRNRSLLPATAPEAPACLLCGLIGVSKLTTYKDEPQRFDHIVMGTDGKPVEIQEDPIGRVQAYTFGYERELPVGPSWLSVGLGAQITAYGLPAHLKTVYGNRPLTAAFFLRFRPAGNMSEHMKQMHR
jgi:hypothetical protein